ncbi:MAG TPA: FAD-dependent oxidoreductase [Sphingobium sp.]|nr:FAD-dependent oxidoreductase [Sphingobium sp.]
MSTLDGISGAQDFKSKFQGDIVDNKCEDYHEARSIWNKDADKYPHAVVRPKDIEDVVAAVRFARDAGLLTSLRCGGHSYQGHSTCDDGIVIDLSTYMGKVVFDPSQNVVRAQGGALLGNVDRAAVPNGRVTPAGIVSHTGLGGLALGGGIGYLTRSFGLTCDQFIRLRVVTASGEVVHVSEKRKCRPVLGAARRRRQFRHRHRFRTAHA